MFSWNNKLRFLGRHDNGRRTLSRRGAPKCLSQCFAAPRSLRRGIVVNTGRRGADDWIGMFWGGRKVGFGDDYFG